MPTELKRTIRFLYFVSFFFSMQYGLVLYINSSFLEEAVGEKIVGLVFTIASLGTILFLLAMPRILNRFGNYRTSIFFALVNALTLVLIGTLKSNAVVIILFLLYGITNYCLVLSLDIFIEDSALTGQIGRTRGLFLTIRNLAILCSPILAVLILASASFAGVYLGAAMLTLASLFFITPQLSRFHDPVYERISVRETFKKALQDENLRKIYLCEFLLCFFYSWMIIYMPIYLHQYVGISWESIGVIFTIMLIPFVIVDYPLGRLSDRLGEKKILAFGFLIITLSTITIFFLKTQSVLLWALALFGTRVGAAAIEVMDESYFFKNIRTRDAGLISFFRNMFPLAFIISPLVATAVIFLIPAFEYLFLVLAVLMLTGFFVSLRLRDVT